MNKKYAVILASALLLVSSTAAFAQSGRDIMQRVNDVASPQFTHTLVRLELIEANGNTETRTVEEWSRDQNGLTAMVMMFHAPASVKDTRFLQVENQGRDDDKWIYLPALRTTRRIAASEGGSSFMGTDATYDDMGTREVDEDNHELLSEKTVNGYDCWEIKSTPVDPSSSQYQYRIVSIDKATLVPVFAQMFDARGNLLKEMTVEELRNVDGYNIPISTYLRNVQTGHATRMAITNIEVNKPVSERMFQQSFLETGRL